MTPSLVIVSLHGMNSSVYKSDWVWFFALIQKNRTTTGSLYPILCPRLDRVDKNRFPPVAGAQKTGSFGLNGSILSRSQPHNN